MRSHVAQADFEIAKLLYQLSPVQLKNLMRKVAELVRLSNVNRIEAQQNSDGSSYRARKHGGNKKMLTGYEKRIVNKVGYDQAIIGIFGRMGDYARVHDEGKTERGVKYPARNILALPEPLKSAVFSLIKSHVSGGVVGNG